MVAGPAQALLWAAGAIAFTRPIVASVKQPVHLFTGRGSGPEGGRPINHTSVSGGPEVGTKGLTQWAARGG